MPSKIYGFVDEVRSRSFQVLVVNIHRDAAATVVAAALVAPAATATGTVLAGAAVIVGAAAARSLAQPI